MNNSTGKRIVLTGATRGLGRSLLSHFVAGGHRVFGCGRSTEHIKEISREFPSPHSFTAVDVRDDSAVKAWADSILADGGSPDLLINNAALINDPAPLWDISAEEFDALIDVNIKGVANVIRAFVPAMVRAKSGVIVNLSSGWGRSTAAEVAPYCATKYAVEGLTLAMAQELPEGMAAIPLNPGVIDTDMLRRVWGGSASSFGPAERWAERAAPFLLELGPRDNGRSLSV